MTCRPAAFWLIALLAAACGEAATDAHGTSAPAPEHDAGLLDAGYPPEERRVSVTLWPIYDNDAVLAATETALPTSLDGVEVCLKSARPHAAAWEDFTETGGPCTMSRAGEPIVIEGVPAQSELIVTATKEGYWPSAFAVITGQWPTDVTSSGVPPGTGFRLFAKASPWPGIEPPPNESMGVLSVAALAFPAWLGGVGVSLEPGPSRGPFYSDGTAIDVAADRTLPSTWRVDGSASELVWANARTPPTALFVDVPERDHIVRLEHPSAACGIWGQGGDTVYGYPAGPDEIRVPVLRGHITAPVLASCSCARTDAASLDPATCEPPAASADGGQP